MEQDKLIFRIVVITLSAILLSVIGAMLIGLFDRAVDNAEVFKILGPAFQTVVGAFVGVLASRLQSKDK